MGSSDRVIEFGELEMDCYRVYEQALESGFRPCEDISRYSQWMDVVRP